MLSTDSFQEEHQVNSSPALAGSFQTSDGGQPPKLTTLSTPVNAIIYTDANQLSAHAQRQQKDVARFKRSSSWKLPGIRLDYAVGDFIDRIVFQGAAGDYKIEAALENIVFDFEKQETVLRPESACKQGQGGPSRKLFSGGVSEANRKPRPNRTPALIVHAFSLIRFNYNQKPWR